DDDATGGVGVGNHHRHRDVAAHGHAVCVPMCCRITERNEEIQTMAMSNAREIVDRYFTALKEKDFAAMRTLVHDDVTFKGALGTTSGAEDYIKGLKQITAT